MPAPAPFPAGRRVADRSSKRTIAPSGCAYPTGATGVAKHLEGPLHALAAFGTQARAGLELADEYGDPASADLLTGIAQEIENQLWFVDAQLPRHARRESQGRRLERTIHGCVVASAWWPRPRKRSTCCPRGLRRRDRALRRRRGRQHAATSQAPHFLRWTVAGAPVRGLAQQVERRLACPPSTARASAGAFVTFLSSARSTSSLG